MFYNFIIVTIVVIVVVLAILGIFTYNGCNNIILTWIGAWLSLLFIGLLFFIIFIISAMTLVAIGAFKICSIDDFVKKEDIHVVDFSE